MRTEITPLAPAEIPGLLSLIRELARFERLEHEMEATEESLRTSFFGANPGAGALLAREGAEIAGYAIYFFTFSSFLGRQGIWLDDVYVRPEFRRRGIGSALIRAVARVGVDRNCGRFEWSALNWNQNALEVYKKMGARVLEDWVLLRLEAEGIRKLAGE